jgi:hypothetical protein
MNRSKAKSRGSWVAQYSIFGDGIISKPHIIVLSLKLNLYDSVIHDVIFCDNGLFKMLRINILVTVSKFLHVETKVEQK